MVEMVEVVVVVVVVEEEEDLVEMPQEEQIEVARPEMKAREGQMETEGSKTVSERFTSAEIVSKSS